MLYMYMYEGETAQGVISGHAQ
uniref:Uncharacterized protein n=1 Tax=Lepeophtheirus salmonis TaxID=72036 RepID=A0A0K2SVW9_LEPSM